MRKAAVFNLPCICQLFKHNFETIIGTDMQEIYLRFIDDKEFDVRMIIV